jgi:RNA polymerase sigma-70 factor (ECF subfamily)
MIDRIEALPGVACVAATNDLPFSGSRTGNSFDIEGIPPSPGESRESDFRVLFVVHHEAVFRVAYRLTNDRERAEDITQDCFLRLVCNRGRFDPARGSLRQFLYGMVRNLVLQFWEARGRDVSLSEDRDDDPPAAAVLPVDVIATREVAEAVQEAVAMLPVLQREAIVLFEFEELSLEEVAAAVNSDVGTVKSRLHRARERLRRVLGPYWETHMPVHKGVSREISE